MSETADWMAAVPAMAAVKLRRSAVSAELIDTKRAIFPWFNLSQ